MVFRAESVLRQLRDCGVTIPDPNSVDGAIRHVLALLRKHAESYVREIVVEPDAWRRRFDELKQDLEWLEFCRDHPIINRHVPPPPKFRR
jgi:hypothetical protein